MNVSDLTNEQLNRKVAEAQGWNVRTDQFDWFIDNDGEFIDSSEYTPSTNWQQAGELVEKYFIKVWAVIPAKAWYATIGVNEFEFRRVADTPQRAICMAVIASVYGDEVSDE